MKYIVPAILISMMPVTMLLDWSVWVGIGPFVMGVVTFFEATKCERDVALLSGLNSGQPKGSENGKRNCGR